MAGPVTLEYRGKIAVITIDNVEKLNALDQDGYYQVASFMREVAEHEEVFVTVLTGKGTFTSLQNTID
jgi:Delta3-Delta2-enoyl-CoA isomerase